MTPESRGDPVMLDDFFSLVGDRASGRSAARAIEEIYGAEALPALDQLLESGTLASSDWPEYERLRASLTGSLGR